MTDLQQLIARLEAAEGQCCPSCGGTNVWIVEPKISKSEFYANELASCEDCGVLWEPVWPDQLEDEGNPLSMLKQPCANCAFRKGSHEQSDPEAWEGMLMSMAGMGTRFYCHKGVPINPDNGVGFDYPEDTEKLRPCRGCENVFGKAWAEEEATSR